MIFEVFELYLLEVSCSFFILAPITFVQARIFRCTTFLSTTGTYQVISSSFVVSSLNGGPLRRWEELLACAAFELCLAFLANQRIATLVMVLHILVVIFRTSKPLATLLARIQFAIPDRSSHCDARLAKKRVSSIPMVFQLLGAPVARRT